ncbi:MAG: hypothetical protein GYA51_07680 [Candidatus Methanofastidiosa archaeon]|nr:hypothetical protein [Candidatus Methanofastidiosa archaeon]
MSINKYIEKFFDELEIYEDKYNGCYYKNTIYKSINNFLQDKTEEKAYEVYKSFFEAYWIGIQEKVNPFLELTQIMKNFEEYGGKLIEKHRDHYIHTVFVFLLGLAIYVQNSNFRKSFDEYALNKEVYPDSYDTKNEEFFYRWGLASLSHDIAYPLEIIVKQANEYIKFVCEYNKPVEEIMGIKINLSTSSEFLDLPLLQPREKSRKKFNINYQKFETRFAGDSISLLSYVISENFKIELNKVKNDLNQFLKDMSEKNFIDHGFFSSIIMLRWYYYLIKETKWNPAYFYFPILDSSTSILLHNYYKHRLMKSPFDLELIQVNKHPIAYLLILCDELQEWDRKGYGRTSINKNTPSNFELIINESELHIKYKYLKAKEDKEFFKEKQKAINKVINIADLFNNGIKIEGVVK